MIDFIRSGKGAAAVTITMLFVSVAAVLFVMFGASVRYAAENTADAAMYNTGRTILSYYDLVLQEKYGIFGLEADEEEIEQLAEKYMNSTLEAAPIKRSSLEYVSAECSGCSLTDPDILSVQIVSLMKYMILDSGFEELISLFENTLLGMSERENVDEIIENEKESMDRAEEAQRESDDDDDDEKTDFASIRSVHRQLESSKSSAEESEPELPEDIVLRNGRIKNSLPSVINGVKSEGAFDGSATFGYAFSGRKGLTSAYDNFMIDEYVLKYFDDYLEGEGKGFFRNEVEYVLYGDMSDNRNCKKTYEALWKIRDALNVVSIYKSTAKRNAALALANELTPGPWSVLTQQIILVVWSTIETSNDMKNLYNGEGVPLIKDDSTWMTDIDGVLGGVSGDGYIKIPGNSGMDYQNYLRILLMTENRDVKLYRIMDLIQINIKGAEREEFTLADHYAGFRLSAQVHQKSCSPFIGDNEIDLSQFHSYLMTEDKDDEDGDG